MACSGLVIDQKLTYVACHKKRLSPRCLVEAGEVRESVLRNTTIVV